MAGLDEDAPCDTAFGLACLVLGFALGWEGLGGSRAASFTEKGIPNTGECFDVCSGQLIPDTVLSFSSAFAGARPSLN